MNDEDNRDYFLSSRSQRLTLPVLFLSGSNDFVCATEHSGLAAPMRESCEKLTYRTVASGHWMQHERPDEVSTALCQWIEAEAPAAWPR